MNYCVDTSADVSRGLGEGARVAVAGTVNGHEFRTNMMPRADGRHRVFLNGDVRAAAGVGDGDRVTVELDHDARPPDLPIPTDFLAALRAVEDAEAGFRAMPPGMRRDAVRSIESARRPETRSRRVAQLVEIARQRLAR
jgi:hypothetical protein